ncbi:MAG: hypothetical protein SH850_15685 [Planctomycetaceae bacterium]|nr:hypothetical protein [Planctomycetaceae bacterium]
MTSPADDEGRNVGTFGALFGLLLIAGLLMFLTAIVLPQALGIVLVFGGFLGIISLHYLLWGCWLGKLLAEEQRREESDTESRNRK